MQVCEIFPSIDGEVNFFGQGVRTVFIRLQGCNLRCRYCDTPKTQEHNQGLFLDTNRVLDTVLSLGIRKVTITGGEPLIQADLVHELLCELRKRGIVSSLETNGSFPIPAPMKHLVDSWVMDYKLPSSGMEEKMCLENFKDLSPTDWVKFVCCDVADFLRSLHVQDLLTRLSCGARFAWSAAGIPEGPSLSASELVKMMSEYGANGNLNVQLHKLLNLP